jgi:hypothetical protein
MDNWTCTVGLSLETRLPLVFVGLPLDSFYQSLVNMSIGLFLEVGKVTLQGNATKWKAMIFSNEEH